MIGRVVSTKMNKTVVVLVESTKTDPLYKKSFKRSKKYLVHDELGVKDGDIVDIISTRPISKNKHWKINKVVGRDIEEIVEQELKEQAAEIVAEVMPEEKESEQVTVDSVQEEESQEKPKRKTKKETK